MKQIEILYKDEWVELHKIVYPEKNVKGYVYSHEVKCDGKKVAILPYRKNGNEIEFFLRHEYTPCWELEDLVISSVTGSVEHGDTKIKTALKELKEETGYEITEKELIDLGECFGVKSNDNVYYLYSCDLTDQEEGEVEGDGTELEEQAHMEWEKSIKDAKDPLVHIMYFRLLEKIRDE